MENYKDRFTPEQLEELRHSALLGTDLKDWERIVDYSDDVPATPDNAFTDGIIDVFRELFEENRPAPPEDLEDENYFIWIDEAFFKFVYGALNEIFKDELTEEETRNTALAIYKDKSALTLITDERLRGALLPQKNKHAYIVNLDNQLRFTWDSDGTPHITTEDEEEAYQKLLERKDIPANCADVELLETLLSAVLASYLHNYGDRITVYYPNFVKAINRRDGKKENHRTDIKQKLRELENTAGVLVEQQKIQRAFVLLEVDEKHNTITFESPYLYSICDFLKKNPSKVSSKLVNDEPLYKIEGFSYLVSAELTSAKNKITAQIVKNLVAGLHRHGNKTEKARKPAKTFKDGRLRKWSISYEDLIKYTPLLNEAINQRPNYKTQILKRSIEGPKYEPAQASKDYHPTTLVEEYLRKYTYAFDYWKDLKIIVEPISARELKHKIIFTHHGYNGDFEERLQLPEIREAENEENT